MIPGAPHPRVLGIVNVTPDSFSDGGRHVTTEAAVAHGLALSAQGADALDVGGESTRPGAEPVPEAVEAARVVPVIAGLRRAGCSLPLSVDTRNAAVADAALRAGATIVNDVSAGTHDPGLLAVVARHDAGVILMHMQGEPGTMQRAPRYGDVVVEVLAHLRARARAAEAAGVRPDRIVLDPGLGFGKTAAHNEAILRDLEAFVAEGRPVLVGASRKSFLGAITGRPTGERLAGSLACVARAREAGVALVRVHDVAASVDLLAVLARISRRFPP